MIADFVISVPAGASFDPRLKLTLESLSLQVPSKVIALCDVSSSSSCKSLAATYSEMIMYTRHGPDSGQSAAINEGWRTLDGRFYGWLNVDDYLAPNALFLARQAFMEDPDLDVVYGNSLFKKNGAFIGLHHEVQPPSDYLYRSNIISQPSCFIRKEALFKVGLVNEDLHYTMDWDLWLRLYDAGAKFAYVPEIFSVVALSPDTKTSSLNGKRQAELKRILHRYTTKKKAQKSMASLWLDNQIEYGRFGHHLKKIMHFSPFQKMRANAFDGFGGTNTSHLVLPLFHYEDTTSKEINLEFETKTLRNIKLGNSPTVTTDKTHVTLTQPIRSGETVKLDIQSVDGNINLAKIQL